MLNLGRIEVCSCFKVFFPSKFCTCLVLASQYFIYVWELYSDLVVCLQVGWVENNDSPKLTSSGQRFDLGGLLFFFLNDPSWMSPPPPVRRCRGPSPCSPPRPMAAIPPMNSTSRWGNTPGWRTSNRNSSWKMGSCGTWRRDTDQWLPFKKMLICSCLDLNYCDGSMALLYIWLICFFPHCTEQLPDWNGAACGVQ